MLMVNQSNLLDYLLPGDIIVADRGLTSDEYAHMVFGKVKIPPFTKGKMQLEKYSLIGAWSFLLCVYMGKMY